MLTPDYFNGKTDRITEIYRQLEDYILQDIAARLLKSGGISGTADRMIWKLEQMGMHKSEILRRLAKLTNMSQRELKELLQDAVLTSWEDDLGTLTKMGKQVSDIFSNPFVMSVIDAEWKRSRGELANLTRSAMDKSQKDLLKMLDEAEIMTASGVKSYSAAVCDILDDYAGKGATVQYPGNRTMTLEAAVRMCVVTSMNQTAAQVTNQYIAEAKSEYVLVSAHLGARTQQKGQPYLAGHENWQGKVYKIRGSEPEYPNLLETTGYDINPDTGEGTVVNPLGLHGYNCRHSHTPWDTTLGNPYMDKDGKPKIDIHESRELYEKQQRQRKLERAIRKTKRELLVKKQQIDMVAETDVKTVLQEDYDRLAYRLRQQNAEYNEYCEENDLQKQYDRIKVSGFKRKQASMANGRATAYGKKTNESSNRTDDKTKNDDNNISSGSSIVNDITDKSIDRVPNMLVGNMDNETALKVQTAHRELLTVARDNNSYEVAFMYDKDFIKIGTFTGDATNINLNVPERLKAIYVMHNHPNNQSFSNSDISWLVKNENVKYFSIVKNNGNVEMLHKTDRFDAEKFAIEYNRLTKRFKKEIERDQQRGYNKVIEQLLTKNKSGLEYVR